MHLIIYLIPLLLPVSCYWEEEPNKFTEFDYCKIVCDGEKHSACNCARRPPRVEQTHIPYIEFRTQMVAEHNRYRQLLASGNETRGGEGVAIGAGDMMVVSYDLELEYIARCRAASTWSYNARDKTGHDKCRWRHYRRRVGQNLSGSSANRTDFYMVRGIKMWYDEIDNVKDKAAIDNYDGGSYGHFTQMVWSHADRVGCAMVYNPENAEAWLYTLICNYASSMSTYPGNTHGEPVYMRTDKPCDSCPNGHPCGATPKYPSLCGKQQPVPTDPPGLIPTGGSRFEEAVRVNRLVVYVVVAVLSLVY